MVWSERAWLLAVSQLSPGSELISNVKGDFMRKKYFVTLVRGTNRKTVTLHALSAYNARHEALQRNAGWQIFDLRE